MGSYTSCHGVINLFFLPIIDHVIQGLNRGCSHNHVAILQRITDKCG
jgi:hypothetical protein